MFAVKKKLPKDYMTQYYAKLKGQFTDPSFDIVDSV